MKFQLGEKVYYDCGRIWASGVVVKISRMFGDSAYDRITILTSAGTIEAHEQWFGRFGQVTGLLLDAAKEELA